MNPPPETNSIEQDEADILRLIEKRLLWLSTYSVHYANNLRAGSENIKIGGHQASSSSVVSLMTAMFFRWLKTGDRLAIKPHASPVLHAAHALRGDLPLERLRDLRAFGGLQAYPSRSKDEYPRRFLHRLARAALGRRLVRGAHAVLHRRSLRRGPAAALHLPGGRRRTGRGQHLGGAGRGIRRASRQRHLGGGPEPTEPGPRRARRQGAADSRSVPSARLARGGAQIRKAPAGRVRAQERRIAEAAHRRHVERRVPDAHRQKRARDTRGPHAR